MFMMSNECGRHRGCVPLFLFLISIGLLLLHQGGTAILNANGYIGSLGSSIMSGYNLDSTNDIGTVSGPSVSESTGSYTIKDKGYEAIIPKYPDSDSNSDVNGPKVIAPSGSEVDSVDEIRDMSKALGYGDPCDRLTIC